MRLSPSSPSVGGNVPLVAMEVVDNALRSLHIIEAFDHFELIHGWMPVLCDLRARVIVHVSEKYRSELQEVYQHVGNVSFRSPAASQSWVNYLRSCRDDRKCTWVIATIGRRPSWFSPLLEFTNLYIVLHDLNYSFSLPFSVKGGVRIKERGNRLLEIIHRNRLAKLMQAATGYLYPTQTLRDYGATQPGYTTKLHLLLPFASNVATEAITADLSAPFHIAIPGAVRRSTRDYNLLGRALKQVAFQTSRYLQVHFLGLVIHADVLREFNTLVDRVNERHGHKKLGVSFYPQGLSLQQYDSLLAAASILITPVRQHVRISGSWEIVGTTKITGGFFDAVRFAKPLYVPRHYDPANSKLFRFDSFSDLAEQIIATAASNSTVVVRYEEYSAEQLRKYWTEILSD